MCVRLRALQKELFSRLAIIAWKLEGATQYTQLSSFKVYIPPLDRDSHNPSTGTPLLLVLLYEYDHSLREA